MNVGNYGQELKRLGLTSLMDLAQLEALRRQGKWEQEKIQEVDRMGALGQLAGAAVGAGLGAYRSYKDGERQDRVGQALSAKNQFSTRKEYMDYLRENFEPEVRREAYVRSMIPDSVREEIDALGAGQEREYWAYNLARKIQPFFGLLEGGT